VISLVFICFLFDVPYKKRNALARRSNPCILRESLQVSASSLFGGVVNITSPRQRPTSLMALKWCLEYGVLPRDKCQAKVAEFEKLLTTSKSNKLIKSESKNKRKAVRESHAPDMDLMGTGGQETIGAMVVG